MRDEICSDPSISSKNIAGSISFEDSKINQYIGRLVGTYVLYSTAANAGHAHEPSPNHHPSIILSGVLRCCPIISQIHLSRNFQCKAGSNSWFKINIDALKLLDEAHV